MNPKMSKQDKAVNALPFAAFALLVVVGIVMVLL